MVSSDEPVLLLYHVNLNMIIIHYECNTAFPPHAYAPADMRTSDCRRRATAGGPWVVQRSTKSPLMPGTHPPSRENRDRAPNFRSSDPPSLGLFPEHQPNFMGVLHDKSVHGSFLTEMNTRKYDQCRCPAEKKNICDEIVAPGKLTPNYAKQKIKARTVVFSS